VIVDLDDDTDCSDLSADLCVVGSGAAGLALASEFCSTTRSTVLLEAGGFEAEPASEELLDCETSGHAFEGYRTGRARVFGGATTLWGGQALPLENIDFEARSWVAHSGWPFGRGALRDYYRRAGTFLRVVPGSDEVDSFASHDGSPLPFDPNLLETIFSRWAPQPSLRDLIRGDLERSRNVRVLLHAPVVDIALTETCDTVAAVHVRARSGRMIKVRARVYILACGAIENARLLLASNRQAPAGIGNECGHVGRFFLDHPTAQVGNLVSSRPVDVQKRFNYRFVGGIRLLPRVRLADARQREAGLLNASAIVQFLVDPDSAFGAVKDVFRRVSRGFVYRRTLRSLGRSALGAPALTRTAWEMAVHRRVFTPSGVPRVFVLVEQEPDPDSRVELSDSRDALGIPRARLTWKLGPLVGRTLREFSRLLSAEVGRVGLGKIEWEPWARNGMDGWEDHVSDVFHHMGTTRMAGSARRGVVDSNSKVFGVDNLYVAGASVFPTGGHSNPTLTLIALAVRLADHLKGRLAA
jgi:choline dehydrogenase-like flavoprotein